MMEAVSTSVGKFPPDKLHGVTHEKTAIFSCNLNVFDEKGVGKEDIWIKRRSKGAQRAVPWLRSVAGL
jgi:hypothetical protein